MASATGREWSVAEWPGDFYGGEMPRISLVTPTYQQVATLRETIESVLRQDHRDLEYWVIDAGSRDGSVELMREYESDPRFHWISEPDRGQSDAINKGLARCTGEIFNWINSDDYLEPGALARVAAAFDKNPQAQIVSGLTSEFRDPSREEFNRIRLQLRATPEASIPVGVFCQPSTFWRTQIMRDIGVDTNLHYVMDWDLWVRYLARHGQKNVICLDDLLAHFRHHDAAKTTKGSTHFYDEAKTVFHKLHLTLNAPEEFLLREAEVRPGWQRRDFVLGPEFDRDRYLGCYAERMVRTWRSKDRAQAKVWLGRTWAHKPWITPWRVKMALRLMG
jgi:glycosyltransferase involved in cell wall biosynthesis